MKTYLKLVVSVGLLVFAVTFMDAKVMLEMLRRVSAEAFIGAVVINLLVFCLMGFRWYRLAITKIDTSWQSQLAVYFKATFLNTFTPANLGGDAYRLLVLKSAETRSSTLLKLLLRERLLGLYGYVIVFAAAYTLICMRGGGVPVSKGNPYLYGIAVAFMAFLVPFVMRPLHGPIALMLRRIIGRKKLPKLEGWIGSLAELLSPKGSLWLMLFTFLGILLWVLSIHFIAAGFGLALPILQLMAVATLVELIRLVPITVQGIGLREGAFAYLLSFFGHNPEQCYVVGLAAYLALSISIVLCGPIGQIMTGATTKDVQK